MYDKNSIRMFIRQFIFSHCLGSENQILTNLINEIKKPFSIISGSKSGSGSGSGSGSRSRSGSGNSNPRYDVLTSNSSFRCINISDSDPIDSDHDNDQRLLVDPLDDDEEDIYIMNPMIDPRNDNDSELEYEKSGDQIVTYVCSVRKKMPTEPLYHKDIGVNFEYLKDTDLDKILSNDNNDDICVLIGKTINKIIELKNQMYAMELKQNQNHDQNHDQNQDQDRINELIMITSSNYDFINKWINNQQLLRFNPLIQYLKSNKVRDELKKTMNYHKLECERIDIYEINGILFCEVVCVHRGIFWDNKYEIELWPHRLKLHVKKTGYFS
jgi:hypothetical protein